MDAREPLMCDGRTVRRCPVPLVLSERETGNPPVDATHPAIPPHLGHDRCSGHVQGLRVGPREGDLPLGESRRSARRSRIEMKPSIQEEDLNLASRKLEGNQCPPGCPRAGCHNAELIDLPSAGAADAPSGTSGDCLEETRPGLRGNLLGVAQTAERPEKQAVSIERREGERDTADGDRAGQCATTRFVHPNHWISRSWRRPTTRFVHPNHWISRSWRCATTRFVHPGC